MLALTLPAPAPAHACTRIEIVAFEPDPGLRVVDSRAPTPFTEINARVDRHPAVICRDDECTSSSCGSFGMISLEFTLPRDDQHDARSLGYRLVWLRGSRPKSAGALLEHSWPLSQASRSTTGTGALALELSYDEVASLDADIALVAIDPAGNESEPSDPIHLVWSGCTRAGNECLEDLGCSVSRVAACPQAGGWGVAAMLLSLAALRRRSRRRTRALRQAPRPAPERR